MLTARLFYSILTNFSVFPLITADCNLRVVFLGSRIVIERTADGNRCAEIVCRLSYCDALRRRVNVISVFCQAKPIIPR